MHKLMKGNFDIKIKRGCTEFDIAFPGYKETSDLSKIVYDKEWKNKEEIAEILEARLALGVVHMAIKVRTARQVEQMSQYQINISQIRR